MTLAESLVASCAIEFPMTRRMLLGVPEGKDDWAPHPKSMPLMRLAVHVATLPRLASACLTTESFDIAGRIPPETPPQSNSQLLTTFDECSSAALQRMERATDEQLSTTWHFHMGERTISNTPRIVALNHTFLGHMIHHRAQLGTYLRLLDLPVPGVFGPSADERIAQRQAPSSI